jgi:hypothetical protein
MVEISKNKRSFLGDNVLSSDLKNEDLDLRTSNHTCYFELIENASCKYKITTYQSMMAKDRQLVSIKTDTIWKFTVIKKTANFYHIKLVVIDHIVKNDTAGMDNFIEFSKMFNRPIDEIVLELNASGEIISVVSQKEIYEKWLLLKNNELLQYQGDESMKGFFEAGENDYSDTLNLLKFNIQYFLFFDTVYEKNASNFMSKNVQFPSKLFQGTNLGYDKLQTLEANQNSIVVKNEIILNDGQDKGLKAFYDTNYKNLVGCDFLQAASINATAIYDKGTGLLKKCSAKIIEKASEHLFFDIDLKIEQIK